MQRIVVHVPTLASRGGAERYACALAAALRDRGHPVALAAVGRQDLAALGAFFAVDLTGVELLPLPRLRRMDRLRPRRRAWQLRDAAWAALIRRWRPDVLVKGQYKSELRIPGTRHIAVCHFPHRPRFDGAGGGTLTGLRGRGPVYPPAQSLVIANSEFTREHVRRRWGVESEVVHPPCPSVGPPAVERDRAVLSVGRFVEP